MAARRKSQGNTGGTGTNDTQIGLEDIRHVRQGWKEERLRSYGQRRL
jgi:hypothetical protein